MKYEKLVITYWGDDLAGVVAEYNAQGWACVKWKLLLKKGRYLPVSKITFLKPKKKSLTPTPKGV